MKRMVGEVLAMPATRMSEIDVARALKIWQEYQKQHDLSDRKGQAAGIDPITGGRIWFGASIVDIAHQREAEGVNTPLLFMRVGYKSYYRKGGRR